jgi:hypothetical protein
MIKPIDPVRFVPHWFGFIVMLGITLILIMAMFASSRSNTMAESDVRCDVLPAYVNDTKIHVPLDCHGITASVGNADLVIQLLTEKPRTVICDKLYINGSVEGCKPLASP